MNLYQKLVEVRKVVPYLQKNTQGFGYKYTSESTLLEPIVNKMNELNLLLVPKVINGEFKDRVKEKVDKSTGEVHKAYSTIVKADMVMIWIDADNPENRIEVPFVLFGEQNDISQAFGTGLTYAMRYFLLKSNQIATDNDAPEVWERKQKEKEEKHSGNAESVKVKNVVELFKGQQKLINGIHEIIAEYPKQGQDDILDFVFPIPSLVKLSREKLIEGGKIIRAMTEQPDISERLMGNTDTVLYNPLAPPVTDEGEVEKPEGATKWKANLDKILALKEQMPESYYEGAKKEFKVKHFNEVKMLIEQDKVIKHLEEIIEQIKQETEGK